MKALPFYFLLIMTFGMAASEKLFGGGVPDWFLQQFRNSLMDIFPGSLQASFFFIAILELSTFATLVAGVLRREFTPKREKKYLAAGIILAQITFTALSFGQRLTHKYDAAGSLLLYAALTYVAGRFALAEE